MGTDKRASKTSGTNPQWDKAGAVETLDEHDRRYIEAVPASCNGRVDGPFGAARRLGINPNTLRTHAQTWYRPAALSHFGAFLTGGSHAAGRVRSHGCTVARLAG